MKQQTNDRSKRISTYLQRPLLLLLTLFATLSPNAQALAPEAELAIIRQTLCTYLDTNPNSAASYLKGEDTYTTLREVTLSMAAISASLGGVVDTSEMNALLYGIDSVADSMASRLARERFGVQLSDTLFAYRYTPQGESTSGPKERRVVDVDLKAEFEWNSPGLLDTVTEQVYIDLIHRQVDYQGEDAPIRLSTLDTSYYAYTAGPVDSIWGMRAHRLYRPVVSDDGKYACYLFSFHARLGVKRLFIFARREDDGWRYAGSYPEREIHRVDDLAD